MVTLPLGVVRQAEALLARGGGNVAAALNAYFDGGAPTAGGRLFSPGTTQASMLEYRSTTSARHIAIALMQNMFARQIHTLVASRQNPVYST